MRLSSERIANLTHKIINSLWGDELIDFESEEKVVEAVKIVFRNYLQVEEEVDIFVRKKIASLSRKVPEGSNEYNILYMKYYEEEMSKRKWL